MVAGRDHGLGRQRRGHGLSNCPSTCVRFESHLSTLRISSHRLSFAITRRHSKNETTCLHRLDARTCVRADVSDALLRLVDEPGGEEGAVMDRVVEGGRDAARAALHFFVGGGVVGGGEKKGGGRGERETRDGKKTLWGGGGVFGGGFLFFRGEFSG